MKSLATRSAVLACGAVLVCLVAALTACSSHSTKARGANTPQEAVDTFVVAINAGSAAAAAQISCSGFTNQAHQAATTGADPGISFTWGSVAIHGTDATAALVETLDVAGQAQKSNYTLTLTKKSGLWLVCGRR